ncbi:TraR/DksA C4-type zinc finger protein [Thermovirga sp.]|uniref:TraR/DksA family transcriptional regulator n=1 Tax=Thermovirga sp. TaxID=2699834 RepID=UPI0025E6390D|nr:TraR/DksA C4-type zinc finger protein [Thermovirga sp.]MBO8153488.1 TraR/DksA C4-type zinc finger protein [Thermovirga sp.]
MNKAELMLKLEKERRKLAELISLAESKGEDVPGPDHPDHLAEHASELAHKEYKAGEVASLKYLLKEVEHALAKLETHSDKFGYCEKCGQIIEEERLNAKPWARYCLRCRKNYEGSITRRKK